MRIKSPNSMLKIQVLTALMLSFSFSNVVINEIHYNPDITLEGPDVNHEFIEIYNNRIESYFKKNIEVIVSRAFASLKKLLNSIYHLITQETVLVVHKGKKYIQEIEEAKLLFAFKFEKFQSITSHEGVILRIKNIRKK